MQHDQHVTAWRRVLAIRTAGLAAVAKALAS